MFSRYFYKLSFSVFVKLQICIEFYDFCMTVCNRSILLQCFFFHLLNHTSYFMRIIKLRLHLKKKTQMIKSTLLPNRFVALVKFLYNSFYITVYLHVSTINGKIRPILIVNKYIYTYITKNNTERTNVWLW